MGLGLFLLHPRIWGKGRRAPAREGTQDYRVHLTFLGLLRARSTEVFPRIREREMAGQDRMSPPAPAPGPPGSLEFGNLG